MTVKKAGCILINKESKEVGLIYRKKHDDFSFPKGHLEKGETLEECAVRETEEETGRVCEVKSNIELPNFVYSSKEENSIETKYFIGIDKKQSEKIFNTDLVHDLVWTNIEDVEKKLSYQNLNEYWKQIKPIIVEELKDNYNI